MTNQLENAYLLQASILTSEVPDYQLGLIEALHGPDGDGDKARDLFREHFRAGGLWGTMARRAKRVARLAARSSTPELFAVLSASEFHKDWRASNAAIGRRVQARLA